MDAQQFLAEFGHIASAPGGIPLLRDLILSLAITGKLTEQNKGEINARLILEQLAIRRTQLLDEQGLSVTRKHKNLGVPRDGFQLPENWAWEFLGYLSAWPLKDGDWIESKDQDPSGDIRIVQLADIGVGQYKNRSNRFITSQKAKKLNCYFIEVGDVLIARLPDPLGRACIFPGDPKRCVTVVDIAVCRCDAQYIDPKYLVHCINSPFVRKIISSLATGTTRQRVATGQLGAIALPVPPIDEQARIVAKVDELMVLCGKLETQQHGREKLSDITAITVFDSLSNAQSPVELLSAWSCLYAEANLLLNSESAIQALRKMILDLAVGGRLSYKEPDDGNAVDLVEQIQTSKKQLIASGLISRRKPVVAETLQETVLPSHWTSLTLDEAISHIDAGWSPACLAHPRRDENTWGVLKTTSVQTLQFLPNEHKELPNSLQPRPQYEVIDGDILITRAGPKNRVAICCVVEKTTARLMISDKLIRFHIIDDLIDARYVALCLSAGESGRILEKQKSGMADSQMNISQDKLRAIPIPLPPRAEQERILTKVEGLMRICNQLSEQLKLKQKLHSRFAASSIASITGIRTQEEEELKAPKTELISKLRLVNSPDIKEQAPLAAILARHHDEMPAGDLWQRYGGDIDAFYAQLKLEVGKGWIEEPTVAEMREVEAN